jgi:hypothetical protein
VKEDKRGIDFGHLGFGITITDGQEVASRGSEVYI